MRRRYTVGIDSPRLQDYKRCWTKHGAENVARNLEAAFPASAIVITRAGRGGRVRVTRG